MAEAAQMVFSSPSAHRYTLIAFKGCQVGYRTWLCWFCLWTKHLRWYIVSPSSALSCDPPLASSKHSLLIFFILVDGGERAVIFDRFRGVLPKVIGEGTHFRIPLIQVCFFPCLYYLVSSNLRYQNEPERDLHWDRYQGSPDRMPSSLRSRN